MVMVVMFFASTLFPVRVVVISTVVIFSTTSFVRMEKQFHRLPWFHNPISPRIRNVVGSLQLTHRVYVTIATVHNAIRASVFVVELSVWSNFIAEFVCTRIEILFMVLCLVVVFDIDDDFFISFLW